MADHAAIREAVVERFVYERPEFRLVVMSARDDYSRLMITRLDAFRRNGARETTR
jgi:hypothetical protein